MSNQDTQRAQRFLDRRVVSRHAGRERDLEYAESFGAVKDQQPPVSRVFSTHHNGQSPKCSTRQRRVDRYRGERFSHHRSQPAWLHQVAGRHQSRNSPFHSGVGSDASYATTDPRPLWTPSRSLLARWDGRDRPFGPTGSDVEVDSPHRERAFDVADHGLEELAPVLGLGHRRDGEVHTSESGQ